MAFCKYCGAKNDEGMRFCIKCGKPLQTKEAVQQDATSGDGWYIQDGNLIISKTDMSPLRRNGVFPWNHAKEEIKSVIFIIGVTKIESGAFDGFIHLENVVMPNDITEIQGCAFQNCKSLKSITIPSGNNKMIQIMANAFKGCDGIKQIQFPDIMPILEEGAFEGCSHIETVQFRGKTYDSIGKLYEDYLGIRQQDDVQEEK